MENNESTWLIDDHSKGSSMGCPQPDGWWWHSHSGRRSGLLECLFVTRYRHQALAATTRYTRPRSSLVPRIARPSFFLQSARKDAANRVGLPSRGRPHLVDSGAFGPAQHRDLRRLLRGPRRLRIGQRLQGRPQPIQQSLTIAHLAYRIDTWQAIPQGEQSLIVERCGSQLLKRSNNDLILARRGRRLGAAD